MPDFSFFKRWRPLLLLSLFLAPVTHATISEPTVSLDDPATPPIILNAETYGVADGLSQSTVTSVAEDDDGYIWIGTLNGLNRFDGKEFRQFYANDGSGLKSSYITSVVYVTDKKKLYIGTDSGLFYFDSEKEKFIPTEMKEFVIALDYDKARLLASTESNNFIIENNNIIDKENRKDQREIKETIFLNNETYTLYRDGSLFLKDKKIFSDTTEIIKRNNEVLALSNGGIYRIDKNNSSILYKNEKIDHIFSDNNVIYLICKRRIYLIDDKPQPTFLGELDEKIATNNIFLQKKINKGIIVSNFSEGFIYIKDSSNFIQKIKFTSFPVWSIAKDEKNRITISDQSEIVKIFEGNKLYFSYNTNEKGAKSAVLIGGNLFIGTKSGLYCVNITDLSTKKIINASIASLRKDSNGIVYAGSATGVLTIINSDNISSVRNIIIDNLNPIYDTLEVNGTIYIASQGGLFALRSDNKVSHIYSDSMVFSVTKDENNAIYFGTNNGIYTIISNAPQIYTKTNQPIFSLIKNKDDIVASSTNSVIVVKSTPEKLNIFNLNSNYGSQLEYNTQGIVKINDNYYLGGTDGVSRLNIKKIQASPFESYKINTLIDRLSIFNVPQTVGNGILERSIEKTNEIHLKYSDYPFTLTFNSPKSSIKKDEIEYNYRLLGLSDKWISSKGINSATYTNLSAGRYVFEVYAVNPMTHDQGSDTKLSVVITPPWWLSGVAKFLYISSFILLVIYIIKSYLRKREIQHHIALSEERLKLSLWGSGDEMWDWDIESGKIYRSNIWGSLDFPKDGQRSGNKGEESNIHPQDQQRVLDALNAHFVGQVDHFEATYRVRSKTGEWLWILDRAKIVERDDKDRPLRMTGTIKNINNFKTAEEQLKLFERAIENISEGVFILSVDFAFVELNEAACDILRTSKEKLCGEIMQFPHYSDDYNQQIKQLLKQQGCWNTEIEATRGDNSTFLMELTIDAIYDEQGLLTHYVGVFSDISRRKQQEEELRRLTNNDLLTGLPNRSNLQVTLENLVKKDHHHTLMILDLDNFKKINDSLGHQVGDELLCLVASRLQNVVPKHTNLYRLGGDEFAILIDKNPDIGSSALIANDIIEAFKDSFLVNTEQLVVGVSIGIVLYPEDEQNELALLRKADIAMYHAKSAGGNRYQFYSESLNRNALRQLEVESLIREGLKEDLFEVYFQPKINLRSNKLAGMEALVRLNHPQHGLIPPGEFIPLAEETGLIVELGDVVLKKACFAAQAWREQGLFNGRVAVNLSSRQFALPDLHTRIESILRLTKLPAANLELEITEGTVIKQPEKAIKVMQQLTKLGISLALDDFGTGYSSLSYLKRFPIHTLKIDKAFVDDIDKSDRDLKMVDSIITIAHNMGLSVVGEGVEQTAQLSILKALNCEEIQGFIYSKAIPELEFTEYLRKMLTDEEISIGLAP